MVSHARRLAGAFVLLALTGIAASADEQQVAGRRAAARPAGNEITGVLAGIDPSHGTFTLRRVGVDVDDVLLERMKDAKQRKEAAKDDRKDPDDAKNSLVVSLSSKAEIYIKFRTSPSVANNVTHPLEDLRPMVGYPVTIKGARRGEGLVADEVVAWRGTPWKTTK